MFDYFQNYRLEDIAALLQSFNSYANSVLADTPSAQPEATEQTDQTTLRTIKKDLAMFLRPNKTLAPQELRLLIRRLSLNEKLKELLFANLPPQNQSAALEELLWCLPIKKYAFKSLPDGNLQIDFKHDDNSQFKVIVEETKQNFGDWAKLETVSDEFVATKIVEPHKNKVANAEPDLRRLRLPTASPAQQTNATNEEAGQISRKNNDFNRLPQNARLTTGDFANQAKSRFIGGDSVSADLSEAGANIYRPNTVTNTNVINGQKQGLFGKLGAALGLGGNRNTTNTTKNQSKFSRDLTERKRETQIKQRRKQRKQRMIVATTIGATGMFAAAPIFIDLLT